LQSDLSDAHSGHRIPVMPPRPARPLSTVAMLLTVARNSITALDEELFDELVVPRRYLWRRVFFVSDPAGIKRVFLDNVDNYPRYRYIRRLFQAGLGTGSLGTEGELWQRHRRITAPALDHRAIAPDIPAMIASAERTAAQLEEYIGGTPINIEPGVAHLLLGLWNLVLTGGDPAAEPMLAGLAKYPRKPRLVDFTALGPLLDPLRPPGQRRQKIAQFNGVMDGLIDARRAGDYTGSRDVIWRLIHLRDRRGGAGLPHNEVRDEAASIIAGGVSPTARAMTWIWYLLGEYPEVQDRLHDELVTVLGGNPPTPAQLPMLTYTRQVIDEAMRLYPPIPGILREAAGEDLLCGHRVPPRSVIAILPWVVHRHRRLWDDPDRFDPDRFLPANTAKRSRFAYVPFAAGPRICVGTTLAMTQMLIAVAALARRFYFHSAEEHPVQPVGRISLHPFGGLHMKVERRPPRH
jgi:cytochrome P450